MTIEEAIRTALEYEVKVRDTYFEAAESVSNPRAASVLKVLAQEEQHHVDYLNFKLHEWLTQGAISSTEIGTSIPNPEKIRKAVENLQRHIRRRNTIESDPESEVAVLEKAVRLETETSNFYKNVVSQVPDAAQEMFRRFIEIEEGHLAIVKAELDTVRGLGFWFDIPEFDLEING